MKIIGLVLMVAAVLVGGFLLSDTIPGYLNNKDLLARHRAQAVQVEQKLASLPATASEDEIYRATRDAERAVYMLRNDQEGIERRRNESLVVGGAALGVFALGAVFFFALGRRKRSPAGSVTTVPA
jgi:precorrin-2 methylase